nr:unnamed protein product [Callosobruchus chinensis]
MLARLYELKEEVKLCQDHQNEKELLQSSTTKNYNLVWLTSTKVLANYDHIQGFLAKLQLWSSRVSSGNLASFTRLDKCLKGATNNVLKEDLLKHLRCPAEEFSRYYANIDPESPYWKLTRIPFIMKVLQLPNIIQEEFLDFRADSSVKDNFQLLTVEQFWLKRYKIKPCVAEEPLKKPWINSLLHIYARLDFRH